MKLETSPSFCAATALAKHQDWLRTVLLARLRDSDVVDEVMQEVAIAAIHQQTKPDTIEHLGPWLYRVALKQILMYRRKAGRRRRFLQAFSQRSSTTDCLSKQYDPLQWLLLRERQQSVQDSLEQLSDRDREILLLKYNDGFSYDQIADRLGITTATVRMRLHRARIHLKNQLTENATPSACTTHAKPTQTTVHSEIAL
jgi:RNA polymerase sigma factor (sigma-70 family)